ncbi:MAG TPA: hypothetical protein VHE35_25495, partial [Kofleriaceae bacterium]|nr:hypothetical protein [Kofleriaceae bacterium]
MAKRSPILGYNHNVRYRGLVFHVQTEDSGIINPHVFSHLFHGGVILSTRKLVYDPDATEEVVKALMQAQHKAVLKDLRRALFDEKIDQYLGGTPGLLPREAVAAEGGEAGAAAGAATVPSAPPVAPELAAELAAEPVVEPVGEPVAAAIPLEAVPESLAPPRSASTTSTGEVAIITSALMPEMAQQRPGYVPPPEAVQAVPEPVHAVPEPIFAVPEPSHAVPEPIDAVPEPLHAVAERSHAVPEPSHAARSAAYATPAVPTTTTLPDSSPVVVAVAREPSAPAIEVIEALEPLSEDDLIDDDAQPFELAPSTGRPSTMPPPLPELDLDEEMPFGSITARTPPPLGVIDETERVPVMGFAEASAAAAAGAAGVEPELPLPEPRPYPREPRLTPVRFDTPRLDRADTAVDPILPEPMLPPPRADLLPSAEPLLPEPSRVATPTPARVEPGRSGPFSPVRVSFVSARGPAPTMEPPVERPPAVPEPIPPTHDPRGPYDVVPLDAIETPPGGVASFADDLLPPPLPPPPPLPARGAPSPGAT